MELEPNNMDIAAFEECFSVVKDPTEVEADLNDSYISGKYGYEDSISRAVSQANSVGSSNSYNNRHTETVPSKSSASSQFTVSSTNQEEMLKTVGKLI